MAIEPVPTCKSNADWIKFKVGKSLANLAPETVIVGVGVTVSVKLIPANGLMALNVCKAFKWVEIFAAVSEIVNGVESFANKALSLLPNALLILKICSAAKAPDTENE